MYLKSIEMQGFKSFANKIKLEFKDGITGIVGPNGSGKSNVADAVRWVLGEQSAKELRGASMQDVIFSGTETRKPMGYASVSLCLDNTDHILSDDYDEVTVTRRVYRSGESEYLINGNVCRLKDVSEMFFDTGIGKEGYSIIGQGQVEKILSGKPEERRELFDEAAGIVKFKKRKNASLKKLEQEKENLVRINDILSELEKQVGPLKEQSETARIFLDKREELKTLDINAFVLEGERQKKELKEIDDKIEIANNDSAEVEKALQANSNKYEDAIKALEEYEKLIEDKRREISEAANLKNKLENDIKILKEQINSLNSSSEYHKKRETELKFEKVKTENDIEALSERKKSVDAKVDEYKSGSKDTTDKFEALKSEISVIDADINKHKDELYTVLNERSRIKSDIQRYDTMLEQSREKLAEIKARIEGAGEDQAAIEKNIEEALKELDSLNETIKQDEEKLEDFRKKRQDFDKELDQMNISHHALEVRYHERKAFLESLKNMAERYEGYGNSIRKVMEYKKENKGIFGVV
nr:AAA family ATPase [Lachnospiraceae bacterium]